MGGEEGGREAAADDPFDGPRSGGGLGNAAVLWQRRCAGLLVVSEAEQRGDQQADDAQHQRRRNVGRGNGLQLPVQDLYY